MAGLPLPYFSTLSHERHDFRKKLLNLKCVFLYFLQRLSGTFLILREAKRNMIIYVYSYASNPLLLSDINKTDRFSKKAQIPNFMKIRPVGAQLFHADELDVDNNRLSQFCKRD